MLEASKCSSKRGPEFCRYHGKGKSEFEIKALTRYKTMESRLSKLQPFDRGYEEALENFEYVEVNYLATERGEKEALEKMATLPVLEADVLKRKLEIAREQREATEQDDAEAYTYVFPASKMDEANKRLEKANRKLARAGIEERFEYEIEEFFDTDPETGYKTKMIRAHLNHPPLNIAGWQFVAAVDNSKAGTVTRTIPGQNLQGYQPEKMVCEHCGQVRHRKSTYLLRGKDGEMKQVGSNCLEQFLGVKPQGMWALDYDIEENEPLEMKRERSSEDVYIPLRDTIATALAASDGGENFRSSSYAQNYGGDSTADLTRRSLFSHNDRDRLDYSSYLEKADEILAATKFDDSTDYGANMKRILSAEDISPKHLGFATSVIGAYNRQNKEARKKEEQVKSVGFAGEVGEKLSGRKVKVTTVFHGTSDYGYSDKPTTMVVLTAEDGKQIKWSASKSLNVKSGDEIWLDAGTVKKHAKYRDEDQTIIVRAKLKTAPDGEVIS